MLRSAQIMNALFKTLILAMVFGILSLLPSSAALEAAEIGPGNLPTGKEADGMLGDFLLRNGTVARVAHLVMAACEERKDLKTTYGSDQAFRISQSRLVECGWRGLLAQRRQSGLFVARQYTLEEARKMLGEAQGAMID